MDEHLISRLVEAARNTDPRAIEELEEGITVLNKSAVGGFVRNVLLSLCWALENKTITEMCQEIQPIGQVVPSESTFNYQI